MAAFPQALADPLFAYFRARWRNYPEMRLVIVFAASFKDLRKLGLSENGIHAQDWGPIPHTAPQRGNQCAPGVLTVCVIVNVSELASKIVQVVQAMLPVGLVIAKYALASSGRACDEVERSAQEPDGELFGFSARSDSVSSPGRMVAGVPSARPITAGKPRRKRVSSVLASSARIAPSSTGVSGRFGLRAGGE